MIFLYIIVMFMYGSLIIAIDSLVNSLIASSGESDAYAHRSFVDFTIKTLIFVLLFFVTTCTGILSNVGPLETLTFGLMK